MVADNADGKPFQRGFLPKLVTRLLKVEIALPCVFFLGALVWGPTSCWSNVLASDHPVRLVLMFGLVLGVVGMTDQMVNRDRLSRSLNAFWISQFCVVLLGAVVLLIIEHWRFHGRPKTCLSTLYIWWIFVGLATLLFARLQLAYTGNKRDEPSTHGVGQAAPKTSATAPSAQKESPKSDSVIKDDLGPPGVEPAAPEKNATTPNVQQQLPENDIALAYSSQDAPINPIELRRWGMVLTLAFMVMALFFLAVRFERGTAPTVNYYEIAAILMVFLLAELGLALVVNAGTVSKTVKAASGAATNASREAQKAIDGAEKMAVDTLANAKEQLNNANVKLKGTLEKVEKLVEAADAITQTELWKNYEAYATKIDLKPEELWGGLDIFGQSWLPNGSCPEGGPHTLVGQLFTSFIGKKVTNGSIRRVRHGIACVTADSVFAEVSSEWLTAMERRCADEHCRLVVWAVTELLPSEFAVPAIWWAEKSAGPGTPRRARTLLQFTAAVMKACTSTSGLLEEYKRVTVFKDEAFFERLVKDHLMEKTLRNWFVWDPRVAQNKNGFSEIRNLSERLAGPPPGSLTTPLFLGWRDLAGLIVKGAGAAEDEAKHLRVLPIPGMNDTPTFVISNSHFGDAANDNGASLEGGLLGVSDDLLATTVDLGSKGLQAHPLLAGSEPNINLKGAYTKLGWEPVGQWYCNRMHCPQAGENAWFAVLSKIDPPFLSELSLEWDVGHPIPTLDLLMVGLRKPEGISWLGAAISNIRFERTECTVQLITSAYKLKAIEDAVRLLCCSFKSGQTLSPGVKRYDTWQNWPVT